MKLSKRSLAIVFVAACISTPAIASDSKHFKGIQTETLEEAVKVFSQENKKLAAMIAKGDLALKEVGEIHQMTYSMENALNKMKSELNKIDHLLHEVHESSEYNKPQEIIENSQKYLHKAQKLVP